MPLALASTGTTTLPDVSIGHSLLQMVIALVVVVACIWGLGKILARMRSGGSAGKGRPTGKTGKTGRTGNGLAVVSRQSLGKDLSIATVRWGDREVLVGIAGSNITFLNDARADDPTPEQLHRAAGPTGGEEQGTGADTETTPLVLAGARTSQASLIETLRNATLRH